MERPQPKELVVSYRDMLARAIRVETSSSDARNWAEREGASFGGIFSHSKTVLTIYVDATYDFDEVVAYLNSYNAA